MTVEEILDKQRLKRIERLGSGFDKTLSSVVRINNTWIVAGGLNNTANSYICDLLDGSLFDLKRLKKGCELAMSCVVSLHTQVPDPKAHFYPALFSTMSNCERNKYLKGHPFCFSVLSLINNKHPQLGFVDDVQCKTSQRIFKVASLIRSKSLEYDCEVRKDKSSQRVLEI